MIPKIRTFFSRTLIFNVIKETITKEEAEKLINLRKEFDERLKKDAKRMLESFEKYMGVKWSEKELTIYIIPATLRVPSIPNPLIVKLRENQDVNIHVLIHELVHRFLEINPQLKNYRELYGFKELGQVKCEALTEFIARRISKEILKEKAEATFQEFMGFVKKWETKEVEKEISNYEKEYNLAKKSLFYYFKEKIQ